MRGLVVALLASVAGAYVAPPRAARRLRPPRSDGGGDDGDEPPAALPIDFGSGGAAWTFEWPAAPAAEPWDGRDVIAGATAYAACHVLATLAAAAALGAAPSGVGAADAAVRAAGAGAFLLAQDRAGAWPLVPLRRGLPAAAVADALDGGRTVAVARVSDATPWPAGQETSDSTSLQREGAARDRSRERIHASRALREMIARPQKSRNERKTTEIRASKVGKFALFSCPGGPPSPSARACPSSRPSSCPWR